MTGFFYVLISEKMFSGDNWQQNRIDRPAGMMHRYLHIAAELNIAVKIVLIFEKKFLSLYIIWWNF